MKPGWPDAEGSGKLPIGDEGRTNPKDGGTDGELSTEVCPGEPDEEGGGWFPIADDGGGSFLNENGGSLVSG